MRNFAGGQELCVYLSSAEWYVMLDTCQALTDLYKLIVAMDFLL